MMPEAHAQAAADGPLNPEPAGDSPEIARIKGLSAEELQQLKSMHEEGLKRVEHELAWREAKSVIALSCKYICPLNLKHLEDPVIASDGYTYERAQIEEVMEQARNDGLQAHSPTTRLPFDNTLLFPNHDLKSRILQDIVQELLRKRECHP